MKRAAVPRRAHRLLWAYIALASAIGVVLVATFYTVEVHNIDDWARQALDIAREEDAAQNRSARSSGDTYRVNSVIDADGTPMAVTTDSDGVFFAAPWELTTYYGAHQDDWEGLGVRLLRSPGRTLYVQRGIVVPGRDDVLYAVDVTAPFAVLEQSMAALVALMCGATIALAAGGLWVTRRLDAADARTRAFFANASHELKTPLAAIRGYAAALGDGTVDAGEAVGVLEREATRMGSLVDSVLALSKVDAGAASPAFGPVDLRETAYAALQDLNAVAQAGGVALESRLENPLLVNGDDDMLFSTVSNMVSNAVAHAMSRVTVEASQSERETVLAVFDDGTPAEGELEDAFERFQSATQGGSGIGLALAREYARLHGGDVVLFREGQVTVCRLTLPRSPKNPLPKEEPCAGRPAPFPLSLLPAPWPARLSGAARCLRK